MKFKIAIVQLDISRDKIENLNRAKRFITEAAKTARIVILPEMFNCPYNAKTFHQYAEEYPGETTDFLSDLAKTLKTVIIAGSIPELYNNQMYNTSYTFNEDGICVGKHRKIHLFDVDIKDGITFKESSVLSAGHQPTVFDLGFVKIGVAICYDMRFPELMRSMVDLGAELIVVPAAFNTTTGPAHWHITARTRAVDNQVYFAVASPARSSILSYKAYGHSMVVNPWGTIESEAGEIEGVIYSEVDLEYLRKIRNELPLLKHRKPQSYC